VSMVTFVLCTGAADFGTWFLGLFGGQRGEAVAEINGRKVYDRDVGEVRLQRRLADDFMNQATSLALYQEYESIVKKFDTNSQGIMFQLRNNAIQRAANLSQLDQQVDFLQTILNKEAIKLIPVLPQIRRNWTEAFLNLHKTKGYKYFAGSDSDEGLLEFI